MMAKMTLMEVIYLKVTLNWISTKGFIKNY